MSEPRFCAVAGKWCRCDPRCYGEDDDYEDATFCKCAIVEYDEEERASRRCKACRKAV